MYKCAILQESLNSSCFTCASIQYEYVYIYTYYLNDEQIEKIFNKIYELHGKTSRAFAVSFSHSRGEVGLEKEEAAQEQSYRIWFFIRSLGIDGLAFFLQRLSPPLASPIASSRLTNGCGRNFKRLFGWSISL